MKKKRQRDGKLNNAGAVRGEKLGDPNKKWVLWYEEKEARTEAVVDGVVGSHPISSHSFSVSQLFPEV